MEKKTLDDQLKADLDAALKEFTKEFLASRKTGGRVSASKATDMPSLIDIRRRVRAVKKTQQITKAMKMVSAAKLRRAQERVTLARPFAQQMLRVLQRRSPRAWKTTRIRCSRSRRNRARRCC